MNSTQLGSLTEATGTPTLVSLPNEALGGVIRVYPSASVTFILLADGRFIPFGDCGSWCLQPGPVTLPNGGQPTSLISEIVGETIIDLAVYHDETAVGVASHSIFCTASGRVYTAGENDDGGLMNSTISTSSSDPVWVTLPPRVDNYRIYCRKVIAARGVSIVLTRDGSVYTSGRSPQAGLGTGQVNDPTQLTFGHQNPNPFIVSDVFALTPDLLSSGFMAVGSTFRAKASASAILTLRLFSAVGSNQTLLGWGSSYSISYWIPSPELDIREPKDLTYLSQDTSAIVDHCTGSTRMSLCNLPDGSAIVWGEEVDQINFVTTFGGLENPGNKTIPSRADVRGAIPPGRLLGLYDENPSRYGFLVARDDYDRVYWLASGLSKVASSVLQPGIWRIKKLVVTPLSGITVLLTTDGRVFTSFFDNAVQPPSLGSMSPWSQLGAFSSLNVVDIIAFVRPVGGTLINFEDLRGAAALNDVGFLALTADNKLYWTGRAPLPAYESGATLSDANEIPIATLFGAANPRIVKLFGVYDWFFAIDSNNDTWTFGETRGGCSCQPDSNTLISPAVRVTTLSNINWIFPIINYYYETSAPNITSVVPESVMRGTIFVSATGMVRCGDSSAIGIWPWGFPPSYYRLPSSLNASNPIVDASFSGLTGIIKLANAELWTLTASGNPSEWIRYDQLGVLKNREASSLVALGPGGGAVASRSPDSPPACAGFYLTLPFVT